MQVRQVTPGRRDHDGGTCDQDPGREEPHGTLCVLRHLMLIRSTMEWTGTRRPLSSASLSSIRRSRCGAAGAPSTSASRLRWSSTAGRWVTGIRMIKHRAHCATTRETSWGTCAVIQTMTRRPAMTMSSSATSLRRSCSPQPQRTTASTAACPERPPTPPSLAQDTLLITPTPAQTGTWTRPEMQSGNGFSMSLADID